MSNPNTPNADQLEFINPKANLNNPARYEGETEPEFLKPPPPVFVLGPNAVYIVDASYWPKKAQELKEGVNPPEPAESQPPVLSSLEPDTLPVWAQDTEVFWKGSNFTEASMIVWNNGEEPTKFIDASTLSTIVKPSTVQAPLPYTLETYVRTGDKETAKLSFTFIT